MFTQSDETALLAFVRECELGRTVQDKRLANLWWMVGTTTGGDYVARVNLEGKTHAGEGSTLADAVNALGTKLVSLGVLRRRSES